MITTQGGNIKSPQLRDAFYAMKPQDTCRLRIYKGAFKNYVDQILDFFDPPSPHGGPFYFMNYQFVLLLNNSYLNSGIPRNSGQFVADQTFHYIESTLHLKFRGLL